MVSDNKVLCDILRGLTDRDMMLKFFVEGRLL